MHRSATAGHQQGELAGIVPAFGDMYARGGCHRFVNDRMDPPRKGIGRQARRARQARDGCFGRARTDGHRSAGETLSVVIAEQKISVGHGRFGAALSVTGRPRLGTGTARPDLEQTELVDAGDTAAAGADLDQLDGRVLIGSPLPSMKRCSRPASKR
jgi:hypothetical protein